MYLLDTIRESVRLTRRGRVVLAVVVLAVVAGWQFGARSLNAIAAPTLAGMVVSALMLVYTEDPTVTLSSPEPGFPGETRTLTASISGSGLGAIALSMPAGLGDERLDRQLTLPATPAFDIELSTRGIYTVGPSTLSYRGPLGLLQREVSVDAATDVVVYPQQYDVDDDSILSRLFLDELEAERQEFDRLREYQSGDPLRHIHWKSSAKHDDFLVMEFSPSRRDDTIAVDARAPNGEVDEMARVAATVTEVALHAGYKVELTTSGGHVPPGQGTSHRKSLLRLLARTETGVDSAGSPDDADIEITSAKRQLVVRIDNESYPVSSLFDAQHVETTTSTTEVTV